MCTLDLDPAPSKLCSLAQTLEEGVVSVDLHHQEVTPRCERLKGPVTCVAQLHGKGVRRDLEYRHRNSLHRHPFHIKFHHMHGELLAAKFAMCCHLTFCGQPPTFSGQFTQYRVWVRTRYCGPTKTSSNAASSERDR